MHAQSKLLNTIHKHYQTDQNHIHALIQHNSFELAYELTFDFCHQLHLVSIFNFSVMQFLSEGRRFWILTSLREK